MWPSFLKAVISLARSQAPALKKLYFFTAALLRQEASPA
jgi:hypothetical protein